MAPKRGGFAPVDEVSPRDIGDDDDGLEEDGPANPEASSGICARVLLLWAWSMIRLGRRQNLQPSDLWQLPPRDDPQRLHAVFKQRWAAVQRGAEADRTTKGKLFVVLWGAFQWELVGSGCWVVLATACQFVWPAYINALVNYAQAAEEATRAGEEVSLEEGVSLAVQMLLWQALGARLSVQSDFALKKLGVACRAMMLTSVYEHMLHLPPQTRSSEEAASRGRLLSLLTQDATKVEQGIMFTHRAWVAPSSVLAGLAYVFVIIGPATFVGFGFMCFGLIPVNKIKKAQQRWQRAKMQRTDHRTRLVEETFAAMKVIKYYGWEQAQLARLEGARNNELEALQKFKMLEAFSGPVNVTIPIITSVVTFIVYALLGNTITPAVAFTVVSLFQIIRNPFNQVPQTLTMYTQVSTALTRLGELFELPTTADNYADQAPGGSNLHGGSTNLHGPNNLGNGGDERAGLSSPRSRDVSVEVPEGVDGIGIRFEPLSATAGSTGESAVALCVQSVVAGTAASYVAGLGPGSELLSVQGESVAGWTGDLALRCLREHASERPLRLRFSKTDEQESDFVLSLHRASFAWTTKPEQMSDRWLLQGLDLTVKRGSLVAIVGSVGCGKSSLLSALLGQMTQISGDLSWSSEVRGDRGLAYVSQEPFLISASVRENILLGQAFDGGRYERVLRVCCLDDDLKQLADGEWTAVGERGVALSGGQKTRISMARALYRKASVVLMDDPLSAVDSHVGQSLMRDAIVDYLGGATRLLVTNQLQLLHEAGADQIVVLKSGEMVQQGDFKELSGAPGAFREMLDAAGKQKMEMALDENTELGEATPWEAAAATVVAKQTTGRGGGSGQSTPRKGGSGGGAGKEGSLTGAVSKESFLAYARAGAGGSWLRFSFLMSGFVVAEICFVTIDSWLSVWADDRFDAGPGFYIGIYAGLTLAYFSVTLLRSVGVARFGVASSRTLYAAMQTHCLYCPMRLFDTVPMGRLLNRFTKDISEVDDALAGSFTWFTMSMLRVLSICSVIAAIQPVFVLGLIPVFKLYHIARQYYRCTSRELQRIESISRSPLYSHCAETIDGAPTIAAHADAPQFSRRFRAHLRNNLRVFYAQQLCETWFSLTLQLLGGCIVGICALSMVLTVGGGVSAGLVGLALSYSNNIVINLNGMIFDWVRAETRMVGVERILEYATDLPQEPHAPPPVAIGNGKAAAVDHNSSAVIAPSSASSTPSKSPLPGSSASPGQSPAWLTADWPRFGAVEFDSVCMRYDPTLPLVLSGVRFSVEAGSLVGVVGRTGSGKSSLFAALFRLVEAESGAIVIDGVDISSLSLSDLRPRLAIIPQEPVVFCGSVRENIDMYGQATDEAVWAAIEAAALHDVVAGLPKPTDIKGKATGLDGLVEARGTNLSVGERQLLCLARAHLRSSKLLLLDEATASVDTVTDGRIQKTIRTDPRFATATRLIIAHRLQTIIDADTVVVMDNGRVGEMGPPRELLGKHPGDEGAMFAGLTADSGIKL